MRIAMMIVANSPAVPPLASAALAGAVALGLIAAGLWIARSSGWPGRRRLPLRGRPASVDCPAYEIGLPSFHPGTGTWTSGGAPAGAAKPAGVTDSFSDPNVPGNHAGDASSGADGGGGGDNGGD